MKNNKVYSYLGFAAKSRNIVSGYNTCMMMIDRNKAKLIIITEDLADNTVKKMVQKCTSKSIEYRIFGDGDIISKTIGKSGKGLFCVTDAHFAEIICKEIDQIQSEREVF